MSPNRWILHLANGPPTVTTATVFQGKAAQPGPPHSGSACISPAQDPQHSLPLGYNEGGHSLAFPAPSPPSLLNSILPTAVHPTLAFRGISQYPSLFPALTHSMAPHYTQDGVWNFISSVCCPEGPCGLIRRHTIPCQPQSLLTSAPLLLPECLSFTSALSRVFMPPSYSLGAPEGREQQQQQQQNHKIILTSPHSGHSCCVNTLLQPLSQSLQLPLKVGIMSLI